MACIAVITGPVGTLFTKDIILLRSKNLFPFFFRFFNFFAVLSFYFGQGLDIEDH